MNRQGTRDPLADLFSSAHSKVDSLDERSKDRERRRNLPGVASRSPSLHGKSIPP